MWMKKDAGKDPWMGTMGSEARFSTKNPSRRTRTQNYWVDLPLEPITSLKLSPAISMKMWDVGRIPLVQWAPPWTVTPVRLLLPIFSASDPPEHPRKHCRNLFGTLDRLGRPIIYRCDAIYTGARGPGTVMAGPWAEKQTCGFHM